MVLASYGLLGPIEVQLGDDVIRPPSPRQRLLLAILLVEADRIVMTDRLVHELWSDELPTDPAGAVRTQISRLRRSLGEAGRDLVTEAGGYRMSIEDTHLDTATFEGLLAQARDSSPEPALEHLEEALALWRGPALEEFSDRPFAQPEAVRLEDLRLDARERRGRILLVLGLAHEAVADLQALAAEHAEREGALALLMEALYRCGRRNDALDLYRQRERELRDELGLDPSPYLQRMEQRILTDSVVDGSLEDTGGARARSVPVPASSFHGREEEVATLRSLLVAARLVTLCGPGGVGKTRLALEVTRQVDEG